MNSLVIIIVNSFVNSFANSLVNYFVNSFVNSFVNYFVISFVNSLANSLVNSSPSPHNPLSRKAWLYGYIYIYIITKITIGLGVLKLRTDNHRFFHNPKQIAHHPHPNLNNYRIACPEIPPDNHCYVHLRHKQNNH